MLVGVVYESLFGNTHEIAEAIAAGIREADPAADVTCGPAAEAHPHLAQADLLFVGAPTHFLGLPSRRSRMMQLRYRNDSGTWYITGPMPRLAASIAGSRPRPAGRAAGSRPRPAGRAAGSQPHPGAPTGVREWLERLPQAARGACAAAFDTRLDKLMAGSAAREIGHSLRERGYDLVAMPEGFSVADFEGPLAGGELERARQWGVEAYRSFTRRRQRRPARPRPSELEVPGSLKIGRGSGAGG